MCMPPPSATRLSAAPMVRGATLVAMPTSKPRYTLTDTGELSELLDAAQKRWPEVADRKALLLRLAEAGGETIAAAAAERRAAVADTAGALSGVYEPGELERLRKDWPE